MKAANKLVIQVSCLLKRFLTDALYKYVLERQPKYLVIVEWWNDSVVRHDAMDMQDALEWMQCYPNECCVLIRDAKPRKGNNFGAIVASRGY